MRISDDDLYKLVNDYNTPFYLYDGTAIVNNVNTMQNRLHTQVKIFYSLKANSNPSIARLFAQSGCGAEVASMGELKIALHSGFAPENIVYSGPGKTKEELEYAVSAEIKCIIIENELEFQYLLDISRQKKNRINVAVRINPDFDNTNAAIKMGGVARQFGIDENQVDELMCKILKSDLNLIGIHVYNGTQILDENQIIKTFEHTLDIGRMLQERFNICFEIIDLGGGFGVPYFQHQKAFNFEYLVKEINGLIDSAAPSFKNTTFIIESGRYLMAPYGVYVTTVQYKKTSKGQTFAITDGGLNHHAAATFRGRTLRNIFPLKIINKIGIDKIGEFEKINIVGPLCTPDDTLASAVNLPPVDVGDLLVIGMSGAYGLTFSPIGFLSHAIPAELMILEKEVQLIRRRSFNDELLFPDNYL